jgi:hypothetical protein
VKPRTLLPALVALLATRAFAASFTVRSEVDARKIGVQDQLQLTVTIEGSGAPNEVPVPALSNLQVVGGPSQSTRVSFVNGRVSRSLSLTWVLQPRAVGAAEVGPLKLEDQTAPSIPIEVVTGSIRPREERRRADPLGDPFARDPFEGLLGRRRERGAEAKLLVEASPSRTRLRVGEPLVLTYSVYTQASISELQFKEAPQFAGFWAEDLERPAAAASGEPATVEGESYRRFPIMRKLLFPTRAGALTVPAATLRIGIPAQGFFDSGGVVERATRPVTLTVEPLPDEPGFSGAVGRYEVSASLDRASLPLGEAATLRFRVQGTGNLKWIDRAPEVKLRGAKVYPPQAKSDLRTTAEGVTGSRTWEFVVVPETSGTLEVPALAFSYFDPAAGRIVSAQTKPLALTVEGGTAAAGAPVLPPTAGATRAVGGLPLRSDLDPPRLAVPLLGARGTVVLVALALLLHAGLSGLDRVRGAGRRGAGRTESARAVRAALQHLDQARSEAVSKERAAVLVEQALHEAFGAVAEADDSESAQAVRALLEEVRFVRYAPQLGDYSEKIHALAARAADTVRRWA